MRYWLYKCNLDGGPAGYWGDWRKDVFASQDPEVQWGGDYSTRSPEVHRYLAEALAKGDVIVAYQTNERLVVGYCMITRVEGTPGNREIWLAPLYELSPGFAIHDHKAGTPLENASAVRGPVMMRELARVEMETLIRLTGAPKRLLRGQPKVGR